MRVDLDRASEAIGLPADDWINRCHEVSLALLRTDYFREVFPPEEYPARVARGFAAGIWSQHSWIAVDGDCFDEKALIVDPTLWCHRDDVEGIYHGTLADGIHTPHGAGVIWAWGKPTAGDGEPIALDRTGLSDVARKFLDLVEPLDHRGWHALLSQAPVGGWPAAEIVDRACDHPALKALVPIDRKGMLTERNPESLYR